MSRTDPDVAVLVAPEAPEPAGLDEIRALGAVRLVRTAAELDSAVGPGDVLAVYDFRTPLVHQLGPRAGQLAWIHAASAGVDAVLTADVAASDTIVTNARGVFDRPIAEYVLGLLLVLCKDLGRTLELQRRRRWQHRETRPFAGRHVLVVGAGSIGSAVARLVKAAGAEVRCVARSARHDPAVGTIAAIEELPHHLGWADDVVSCLPLTDATRELFDGDAFAAMRPGATFVNVGRGGVVDEAALVDALRSGRIGGAGLDVFQSEPLPEDHPLWQLENVIVSPHMSGDEVGWQAALTAQFAGNLARWRAGEPLENVVHGNRTEARR